VTTTCACAGTDKTLRDTQIAETQITQDVQCVTQKRKRSMKMSRMFQKIFDTDMNLLAEEVPAIQKEINAEHNVRNMGSGKVTDHIISQHDFVIRQALAPRQL
jgi:hypothetical protein